MNVSNPTGAAYFTGQSNPARVLGTVYQNTSGNPMLVTVAVQSPANTMVTAYTDSANPPTTLVGQGGSSSGASIHQDSLTFLVLKSNYYKVVHGSGTILAWTEWT